MMGGCRGPRVDSGHGSCYYPIMPPPPQVLCKDMIALLSDPGRTWVQDKVAALQPAFSSDVLQQAYSAASRHAGKAAVASEGAMRLFEAAGAATGEWTVLDLVRACLLLAAAECLGREEFISRVEEILRYSDGREQASLLKSLPFLPYPDAWLRHAREACRANTLHVFEAIACGNSYPARHFDRDSMNQLIMKAVFLGVALRRVVGIDETANAERSRIALDFSEERAAAGRAIPHDLWRLVGKEDSARSLRALQTVLNAKESAARIAAAMALAAHPAAEAKANVKAALQSEMDEQVAAAMQEALAGRVDWSVVNPV